MLTILKYGGFKTGGVNFDAKVRRESFEPVDLFYAHIGGMDAFARGLKIAAAIRKDGRLARICQEPLRLLGFRHRREDRVGQGRLQGTGSLHAQEGRSGRERQRPPGIPGKPHQRIYLKANIMSADGFAVRTHCIYVRTTKRILTIYYEHQPQTIRSLVCHRQPASLRPGNAQGGRRSIRRKSPRRSMSRPRFR